MNYLPDGFRKLSQFQQIASVVWVSLVLVIVILLISLKPLLSTLQGYKLKNSSQKNNTRKKKDKRNKSIQSKGF